MHQLPATPPFWSSSCVGTPWSMLPGTHPPTSPLHQESSKSSPAWPGARFKPGVLMMNLLDRGHCNPALCVVDNLEQMTEDHCLCIETEQHRGMAGVSSQLEGEHIQQETLRMDLHSSEVDTGPKRCKLRFLADFGCKCFKLSWFDCVAPGQMHKTATHHLRIFVAILLLANDVRRLLAGVVVVRLLVQLQILSIVSHGGTPLPMMTRRLLQNLFPGGPPGRLAIPVNLWRRWAALVPV